MGWRLSGGLHVASAVLLAAQGVAAADQHGDLLVCFLDRAFSGNVARQ